MSLETERKIEFDSIKNFRDLGGLKTTDGRHLKSGLLFRSADPSEASPQDIDKLVSLGVTTWIDMRGGKEVRDGGASLMDHFKQRSPPADNSNEANAESYLTRLHIDMTSALRKDLMKIFWSSSTLWERLMLLIALLLCQRAWLKTIYISFMSRIKLNGLYILMMEYCRPQIFEALRLVTTTKSVDSNFSLPLFITSKCVLGKDRTGVLAALILLALGVPRDVIAHDYALTEHQLDEETRLKPILKEGADSHFATASKEQILIALEEISSRYGSMDNYLDSVGFDSVWRTKLKDKMLEVRD